MMASINNAKGGHSWKGKFNAIDLPNFTALDGELELWERYWATYNETLPDNCCGLRYIYILFCRILILIDLVL